jgi:1,4-dihydroxy-2-naphthoate octaprenyltransferase
MVGRARRSDKLAAWRLAIRLPTLPAAVGPVLVGLGVGLGEGAFRPVPALLCLGVAVLLQVAANLANDLFDFRRGADAADRLGPPRAAALGLLSERELVVGTGVVLVVAAAAGLGLVALGGPVLLGLGAAAIVAAIAYTGGPFPYGYRGLGEVFVFVFFGLVGVAGTAYLQLGTWAPLGFAAAVPVGCLVTAILVVNNLRDVEPDRRAGKRTLAVRFGAGFARAEYAALWLAALAVPPLLVLAGAAGPAVLLPLLVGPLGWRLVERVRRATDPRDLNPVLRSTARAQLGFAVLFAAGLALGGAG